MQGVRCSVHEKALLTLTSRNPIEACHQDAGGQDVAAESLGQESCPDLEPLPCAGLLSENVIHRDIVAECRGLPAAMEYADVSLTQPALRQHAATQT